MRLKKLRVENFKGLKNQRADEPVVFEPDGKNAIIRGDNGTGKTSLHDAWSWLLTGKDSSGRADFAVKPLDGEGQERHGLDVSVEAVVDLDGTEKTLQKVYKEKWTKRRGEAERTLTGHTTDHQIDGVPVQKKEWDAAIATIAPANVLSAASPTAFLGLHWQKRRELILDMAGDVDDAEIIGADPELSDLPDMLAGKPLGDALKIAKARKSEANKAIDNIPPRIDELSKSLEAAPKRTAKQIEAEIASIEKEIAAKKAGSDIGEKRKKLAELEADLAEAGGEARKEARLIAEKRALDRSAMESAIRYERLKAEDADADADRLRQSIEKYESGLKTLREKWQAIDADEYRDTGACPTCGQDLPDDQIEAAREQFNLDKAKRLAEINDAGKSQKAEVDRLKGEVGKLEKVAGAHRKEAGRLAAERDKITDPPTPEKSDAEKTLEAEIEALRKEVAAAPPADVSGLEASLRDAHERLSAVKNAADIQRRIVELKAEEKRLSGELSQAEKLLFLAEKFEMARASALEEKANALFQNVRWKLFDVQINGGISPTCVATVNGVPAGYGLNRGAEISAGVEIADKIMSHYGVSLPIIVDNAEAVVSLPQTEAQTIALYVVEGKPELEVTTNE